MVWVNGEDISTENIVTAISTKFSSSPTAMLIQGDISNVQSSAMAAKLCQKMGKQYYVSWNVANLSNPEYNAALEKEVFRLCANN